jgi:hypothetical protein
MSSDQCPRCGSTHFREEVLVEIPRFSAKDALELQVEYPISILVCLCGYRATLTAGFLVREVAYPERPITLQSEEKRRIHDGVNPKTETPS